MSQLLLTHYVPKEVGDPIDNRAHTTDKLEMLGFCHLFLDQV